MDGFCVGLLVILIVFLFLGLLGCIRSKKKGSDYDDDDDFDD